MKIFVYILLPLLITSCYEQINNYDNEYILNGTDKGTIIGRVTTTYGDGVNTTPVGIPNANVQLLIPTDVKEYKLLNSITTDNEGNFLINDVPTGSKVIVNIKKDGYVENQKITKVVSEKISYITAAISNFIDKKTFQASEGLKFHSFGVDIDIPPNSLIKKNGSNFGDEARLEIAVYEASRLYYCDTYPGNFSGINKEGQKKPLFSFFLVNIKIFDGLDELYLKQAQKINIAFPILKTLQSKASNTIPLWHYNLLNGEWNEVGTAQKSASDFIGESTELGFLTIAMPVEISSVTGKVIDENGQAIEHARVKCKLDNFEWMSETYSEKDGRFSLDLIANSSFTVWADYLNNRSEPKVISNSPSTNQSEEIGNIVINTSTTTIPGKWVKMEQFTEYNLNSICFKDENTGWITAYKQTTTNQGKIFKTTDGGNSWTEVYSAENSVPLQIFFKEGKLFVNEGTSVLKSLDLGKTWEVIATNSSFIDMYFIDENYGWGFGTLNQMTTDGGATWLPIFNYPFDIYLSVFFIDRINGWATGPFNIIKTTDGGNSWNLVNTGDYLEDYTEVYFQTKDIGYLLGQNGLIKKTIDNGKTWVSNLQNGLGSLYSINFVNQSTGWIVGSNGTILFTNNQGSTWHKYTSITNEDLKELFFLNNNLGWIVGRNGTLLKYTGY